MVFTTDAFVVTWAFGVAALWLTSRVTRSWRRARRIPTLSLIFAIFFAPAAFAGHGIAVCPAIAAFPMSLLVWHGIKPDEAAMTSAISILVIWLLATGVLFGATTDTPDVGQGR